MGNKNSTEVRDTKLFPQLYYTGGQSTRREIKSNRGELKFISVETVIDPDNNYKEKIYYRPVYITDSRNRPVLDTSPKNIVKIFHTSGPSDFPGPLGPAFIEEAAIWDYSEAGKVSIYYFSQRPNTKKRETKRDQNQRDCFYTKKEIYDLASGFLLYEALVNSFGYDKKGYCTDYVLKETAYNYGGPGEPDEIIIKFFKGTGESSTEITEDDYNNIKNSREEKPQPQYQEPQPRYQEPALVAVKPKSVVKNPEQMIQELNTVEDNMIELTTVEPISPEKKPACYFVIDKFDAKDKIVHISVNDIGDPLSEEDYYQKIQNSSLFRHPYATKWDLDNFSIDNDGSITIISSNVRTKFKPDKGFVEDIKRKCGN
jgi:hypothetical protein